MMSTEIKSSLKRKQPSPPSQLSSDSQFIIDRAAHYFVNGKLRSHFFPDEVNKLYNHVLSKFANRIEADSILRCHHIMTDWQYLSKIMPLLLTARKESTHLSIVYLKQSQYVVISAKRSSSDNAVVFELFYSEDDAVVKEFIYAQLNAVCFRHDMRAKFSLSCQTQDSKFRVPSVITALIDFRCYLNSYFDLAGNGDFERKEISMFEEMSLWNALLDFQKTPSTPKYTGLNNSNNQCFIIALLQVILRIPKVQEFLNNEYANILKSLDQRKNSPNTVRTSSNYLHTQSDILVKLLFQMTQYMLKGKSKSNLNQIEEFFANDIDPSSQSGFGLEFEVGDQNDVVALQSRICEFLDTRGPHWKSLFTFKTSGFLYRKHHNNIQDPDRILEEQYENILRIPATFNGNQVSHKTLREKTFYIEDLLENYMLDSQLQMDEKDYKLISVPDGNPPHIICVNIMRYTYNNFTNLPTKRRKRSVEKLNKRINISNRTPFLNITDDWKHHQLMAVISHLGLGVTRGHYVTYMKLPWQTSDTEDNWNCFNDGDVTKMSFERVVERCQRDCYLLFYANFDEV